MQAALRALCVAAVLVCPADAARRKHSAVIAAANIKGEAVNVADAKSEVKEAVANVQGEAADAKSEVKEAVANVQSEAADAKSDVKEATAAQVPTEPRANEGNASAATASAAMLDHRNEEPPLDGYTAIFGRHAARATGTISRGYAGSKVDLRTGAAAPQMFLCAFTLFFLGILCSAAGVGGGGIYVSVLMVMGNFSPHDAVPLSHSIVFIGAIATLIVNLRRWFKTGEKDVDMEVCMLAVPSALFGTLIGFMMNKYVRDQDILKVLVVLLVILTCITTRTWWNQYCLEALAGKKGEDLPGTNNSNRRGRTSSSSSASSQGTPATPATPGATLIPQMVQSGSVSTLELLLSVGLLFTVVICSALHLHMDECASSLQLEKCDHYLLKDFSLGTAARSERWMLAVQALPIALCALSTIYWAQRMFYSRCWTLTRVAVFESVACGTGCLSGLVGVGGGVIFSPFFLLTMDPLIAVGTSSACVLFTACSSTFQYFLTDRIILSLALIYGSVVFAASVCGTSLIYLIRSRYKGGKSYITLIVALAVALSAAFVVVKIARLNSTEAEEAAGVPAQ